MNPARFNKARHDYGTANQSCLVPFLEKYLGESITETKRLYDTIDGYTQKRDIEIKTRTKDYHYFQPFMKEGWLVPACKIQHARESGRPFVCFYYWKADESVWEFSYSEEKLEGLIPRIPSWHPDKQLHYYIPEDRWRCIRNPNRVLIRP